MQSTPLITHTHTHVDVRTRAEGDIGALRNRQTDGGDGSTFQRTRRGEATHTAPGAEGGRADGAKSFLMSTHTHRQTHRQTNLKGTRTDSLRPTREEASARACAVNSRAHQQPQRREGGRETEKTTDSETVTAARRSAQRQRGPTGEGNTTKRRGGGGRDRSSTRWRTASMREEPRARRAAHRPSPLLLCGEEGEEEGGKGGSRESGDKFGQSEAFRPRGLAGPPQWQCEEVDDEEPRMKRTHTRRKGVRKWDGVRRVWGWGWGSRRDRRTRASVGAGEGRRTHGRSRGSGDGAARCAEGRREQGRLPAGDECAPGASFP